MKCLKLSGLYILGLFLLQACSPATKEIPEQQRAFSKIIYQTATEYEKTKEEANAIAATNVRSKRKNNLMTFFSGSLAVSNWVGEIVKIENSGLFNDTDDDIHIQVKLLNSKAIVETHNNSLSDMDHNTLIKRKSDIGSAILGLKIGDIVVFDGVFFDSATDYIYENSVTEEGSMKEPEFIFRFTGLRKHQ